MTIKEEKERMRRKIYRTIDIGSGRWTSVESLIDDIKRTYDCLPEKDRHTASFEVSCLDSKGNLYGTLSMNYIEQETDEDLNKRYREYILRQRDIRKLERKKREEEELKTYERLKKKFKKTDNTTI